MASEKEIVATFEKIAAEVPGYIAASLVDLDSGLTLGVHSNRSDFDLAAASAYNSEIVKQKTEAIKVLGPGAVLEDILLTLSEEIHLIKLVTTGTFIYLAADRSQTNLAIVRTAVAKHVDSLA